MSLESRYMCECVHSIEYNKIENMKNNPTINNHLCNSEAYPEIFQGGNFWNFFSKTLEN